MTGPVGRGRDGPDAIDAVRQAAREAGLDAGEGGVIVMVSGGRDSICLLDVAVAVRGAHRVDALHVNYGLRASADAAEALVGDLCRRLGVKLHVERAVAPGEGAGNLQAWARDVRYAAATRLALRRGAFVAAGHTSTDQVETVLYRLAASPGRRAMLGMTARDGLLSRPLLLVSREETGAYCEARGLSYDDDESNAGDRFARGRVRHRLVAALREVHPAAERNVLRTVALMRDEGTVLDGLVEEVLGGQRAIELSRLGALPRGLARLIVVRLAEDVAGHLAPAAGRRLDELLVLGERGGSAALHLGDGVSAVVEYGVLRMSTEAEQPAPAPITLGIPGEVQFGHWFVRCEIELAAGRQDVAGSPGASATAVFDADIANGPLLVRAWRRGDRMTPVGLGGSKTLADLFTDRRLPRARRGTIPVVEADGQVAWVPGIAADERFRVGTSTTHLLRISASGGDPA